MIVIEEETKDSGDDMVRVRQKNLEVRSLD
jgi:hypothetical protein